MRRKKEIQELTVPSEVRQKSPTPGGKFGAKRLQHAARSENHATKKKRCLTKNETCEY